MLSSNTIANHTQANNVQSPSKVLSSAVLKRLINEVRVERLDIHASLGRYDRVHNRHNR